MSSFRALLAMLHVVDPASEDERDKLGKVASFLEHFKERCKTLCQPFQQAAVNGCMVKSKHRSSIQQNTTKPTK